MTEVVEAHGLSKTYGRGEGQVRALVDVSFAADAGRLTVIAGPSGSGKTTLLHCLSGLARPDEGSVLLGGAALHELSDAARAELRRDRMAFVFQRDNLLPALTVVENVALPLLMRALPRDEVDARVTGALAKVGLAGRGRAFPSQLSGGEAQRVAVARAVSAAPAVVWADEPTGALDSGAAADVLALLRDLAAEGACVVVVSHDPTVAAAADQLVSLADGRRTA